MYVDPNTGGILFQVLAISFVILPFVVVTFGGLALFRFIKRRQTATRRKCPYCAELILREANLCRHCKRELPPLEE